MEFRAWDKQSQRLYSTVSEFNAYEWAENNEFYFMYHASQFCINTPYIIFCPFDERTLPIYLSKNKDTLFNMFRILCRRIFINLLKMENRKICDFDGKAQRDISVATASRKISAIVFMDVSEEFDYRNCRTFVYQNPNADHKIPNYQIQSLFTYAGADVENFLFDNY